MSALLGGCTPLEQYVHNGYKVGPNYARPPAPVAEHWIDAADVRVRKESDDLSRRWTVFNDPVLDGLVRVAYGQNLTLRQAGFRVLQARASLGIAVGEFFPQQQDAAGAYQRRALSVETANRRPTLNRFYDQWNLGFSVGWELDFWGRFRRAIESADATLDASVEGYDDVLVTLLADVAANYVQYRILEQQLVYTRQNVGIQKQTLELAQARFKGGQTSELDVDHAQSNLSQTEAVVPQLETELRQVNNALCVLLGIPPEDLKAKLGDAAIPTAPLSVGAGIPAELLTRRPDVRRAEREAAAQCAQIGVAVSALYPHISLIGTVGYASQNLADLFRSTAFTGTFGPTFTWDVLNYGRLVNNIRLEDARFQEIVTRYQETVLRANREAEDGLVTFLKSQQRSKALAESVTAAAKAVRVAVTQYRNGLIDLTRVALLEQNLVNQQNQQAQATGDIALGLIRVYRALGGGWEIRCEQPAAPAAPAGRPERPLMPPAPDRPGEPLPQPKPQGTVQMLPPTLPEAGRVSTSFATDPHVGIGGTP
jgi:NodT family efflux transporter outer membrane factor (OMF) lipoprotein